MLSAAVHRYVIGFYGYAFGGTPGTGFGNEWTRNLVVDAAGKGGGTAKLFAEETGRETAEKYLFAAMDTNHDKVISAAEIKTTRLRIVGYSLGGIEAANFTRDLDNAGKKEYGYKLAAVIPVESLVTLDPVNFPINAAPLKQTDGPRSNVRQFFNFYEGGSSDGSSSLQLFQNSTSESLGTTSYNDTALPVIGYLNGDSLDSDAGETAQYRVDSGKFAKHPIRHGLDTATDDVDGQLTGKQTDHGTLPFYAYSYALPDLLL